MRFPKRKLESASQNCSIVFFSLFVTVLFTSCFNTGGLNTGQHNAGNEEDGVHLRFGDIAVDPTGTYFVSRNQNRLIMGNIAGSEAQILEGIDRPVRLAFGKANQIFVTSTCDGGQLVAYDVQTMSFLWKKTISVDSSWISWEEGGYPFIDVSENGEMIILRQRDSIRIISSKDGSTIKKMSFDSLIIDTDLHPDGDRVIVTLDHTWDNETPNTKVVVFSISMGTTITIDVPNCSDEMVLDPTGDLMFLAPTRCAKDPVSVIDLRKGEFVRNLPGFGPVAMSPAGDVAVAFMDMHNLDLDLFDEDDQVPPMTDSQYRLMFIDVETLNFDTIEIGNSLPRYAMTPDGKVLLVDTATWFTDARIRVLDIPSRTLHKVAGPEVQLENFVITSDSTRVYLLDSGLYELSIPERLIYSLPLTFTPENINITPDDQTLLVREDDSTIWVYDVQSGDLTHSIEIDITVDVSVDISVDF